MKIIIDIPKSVYEEIKRKSLEIQIDGDVLENAVLNGRIVDFCNEESGE